MSNSFSLAFMKSPLSAVVSTSFTSFGSATDASEKIVSGVIVFSDAALCIMFVAFLQSPSAIVTSASFASCDIVSFSFSAMFVM